MLRGSKSIDFGKELVAFLSNAWMEYLQNKWVQPRSSGSVLRFRMSHSKQRIPPIAPGYSVQHSFRPFFLLLHRRITV